MIEGIVNLFCIPYAGGSARAIYGKWANAMNPMIKVIPLELAGHGHRMAEPLDQDIKSIVDDLLNTISHQIEKRPYALYAHSMGTVIAYELAVAARNAGLPQPVALFLSGRQPPHYQYAKIEDTHLLPDKAFIEKIIRLGGTPIEVFQSKDLVKLFLPILRNDYRIIEQYRFTGPPVSFDTDLLFFGGNQDHYLSNKAAISEWKWYTSRSYEFHEFQGGHFFINEVWQDLCDIINRKLIQLQKKWQVEMI